METAAAGGIVALAIVLICSLERFLNELYYRKRVSIIGSLLFIGCVYLMWYGHALTKELAATKLALANYESPKDPQPVPVKPQEGAP